MNDNLNNSEVITMSEARLNVLENEVRHVNEDVSEIKRDIREMRRSSESMEVALTKLAAIAESNQQIEPKMVRMEERVNTRIDKVEQEVRPRLVTVERKVLAFGTGLSVVLFAATFLKSPILSLLGL